jgi:Ice-binding-like/Bacterial Ig-like domain
MTRIAAFSRGTMIDRPRREASTGGLRRRARFGAVVSIAAMIAALVLVGVETPTSVFADPPIATVPLGSAASFAVLTLATVGNTATGPVTTLRGDLGAGAGVTAFPPGIYTGSLVIGTAANPALADLGIAYDNAKGRPAGLPLAGDLIGTNAGPGVHTIAAAVANTGTFTIDAGGNPNAVFIFQIGGALAMAAGSHVVLAGAAKASNVFWVVTGAGAVGANATFAGTLMASAAIDIGANTIFNGRALSKTGAIALNSNEFYASAPIVSIDPGTTAYTTDTSPTITGVTTVRSPSAVTVTINGETLTATPSATGIWSATPAGLLANSVYAITASVIDGADNTGTFTQQLTVDTVPPAVAISGGPSVVTNRTTPTLTGTTDVAAGQPVVVTMIRTTPALTLTRSTVVQADGTWNITPNGFTAGVWTVTATVTDPAGNQNSATQAVTIDVTAPTATINGGATALTNDTTPTIAGTTEPGSIVTVSVDGAALTGVSYAGANWSVTVAATPLAHGVHNVGMVATDPAGNATSVSQTLTVDTASPSIAIDGGAVDATNDRNPTISGSSNVAVGVTVTVIVGSAPALSALVQANGTWSAMSSALLDPGTYNVVASVPDPAGNVGTYSQSLTIDTSNPTVSIVGGPSRSSTDATPTISGSSPDVTTGSPVTVTVAGQTLSTTTAADGTFTVTAATITNGTHVVFVTVGDAAGNFGSDNQSLTILAIAPTVTITGGANATTSDATPMISGSSNAVAGSPAVVTIAGQTLHATVQPGGSWNVTAAHINDNVEVVWVSVTDPDGNVGVASQSLTVDTVAPIVTVPGNDTPFVSMPPVTTPPPEETSSGFSAVGPKRVFDTRAGQSANALRPVVKQQVSGDYELQVQMTDLAGYVPASGVSAVSLNVTATGSVVGGFITVYACGTRELVSSVNFPGGTTVANAVVAPVSASGTVCFYANTATDIVVDINGWFATGAAFASVGPKRVFDTRPGSSPEALRTVPDVKIPADGVLEVHVTDLAGYVPVNGVGSVSLNVVVTNPEATGFITVYSCGTRALVSSLNFLAGQTVANAVIARVSGAGTVCFYSSAATDMVVDINGWAQVGSGFHSIDPARVLDTRPGNSPGALREVAKVKIAGGYVLEVRVTDLAGRVPAGGVTAVSLNVTATNPDGDGFVTVYACGAIDEVSSLNYAGGQTVANAVLAPVSATGTICLSSNVTTDVIVDINGWIGITQVG